MYNCNSQNVADEEDPENIKILCPSDNHNISGINDNTDQNENGENQSNNLVDYDQDIISAQDIESGKDITDITDFEKDDIKKDSKEKNLKQVAFVKKKFAGEQMDEIIDKENESRAEGLDKRKVVEKSPKERFARFDEELGAGAIKRVYRGYDYDTGREIAWNVVNVFCMSDDAISKVQEEIAIIKKLKHPNIINFVSGFFNEEKKEVVIITEIFTSGSLKQYLNRIKHPRLKVIKFWCKEILKGLKYLHELPNPIIHRDIKCDNVFINSTTSEIKIGDLGYSCILSNKDYAKSVSGTPEFMAPEVLEGKYGVLADIYSFGICMLEIVTREKPYKECENHVIDIFENIKNHVLPKSIEKIKNQRLLEFIKSCFKPVWERPSADDLLNSEFLNDLEHEENNFPALQYPPSVYGDNHHLEYPSASYHFSQAQLLSGFCERTHTPGIVNHEGGVVRHGQCMLNRENCKWPKSNKEVSPRKSPIAVEDKEKEKVNLLELNNVDNFQLKNQIHTGMISINNYGSNFQSNNSQFKELNLLQHDSSSICSNMSSTQLSGTGTHNSLKCLSFPKKGNDIVGLRHKKSKTYQDNNPNNKESNNNILLKYQNAFHKTADNLQNLAGLNQHSQNCNVHQYSSSSEDMEDYPPSHNHLDEKYHNDPSLVRLGDMKLNFNKNFLSSNNTTPSNKSNTVGFNPFSAHFKNSNLKYGSASSTSSKIEIKIEEEYRDENAIKISLVKKEKPKAKGQKISFKFDLSNDTAEKILKELENERIGLNEEEKKIFTQKLSNLIKNYFHTSKHVESEINQNNHNKYIETETKDQNSAETQILFDKFLQKYSNIKNTASEILKGSSSIKQEIKNLEKDPSNNTKEFDLLKQEFLQKMKVLEDFVKLCS
jgi:serine/threonine protein kinase